MTPAHPRALIDPVRPQGGLTLVELMVSMVIGVVLLVGVVKVYTQSNSAYQVSESAARLQDTARYALSVIEPDVRMAGYWGYYKGSLGVVGAVAQTAPTAAIGGAGATTCGKNFDLDLTQSVQGSNDAYTLACAAFNGRPVVTADTLTVRRSATTQSTAPAAVIGPLRVCSSYTSAQLVNTAPAAQCPVPPNGSVADLVVNTYYVARDSQAAANSPALRMWALTPSTVNNPDFVDTEIVPGVEDMQVQFGIDWTGGSCVATQYVDAFAPAAWPAASTGQIVSVRVWLLVRADAPEQGFIDNGVYQYGNRALANGTTASLNTAGAAGKAYKPADAYRRLLVSRTFVLRNAVGC